MSSKEIYYVGPFSFPWGEAASRRVMGVSAALASAGHRVTVFPGRGVEGDSDLSGTLGQAVRMVDGLDEVPTGRLNRAVQWAWGMGGRTLGELEVRDRPDVVIAYGGSFPYLRQLLPWCRDRRIPLILDMVEWYDPRAFPGGSLGPIAVGDRYARRFMHFRAAGVIAISDLLHNYYAARGVPTVLVPPTSVSPLSPPSPRRDSPVSVAYAGTPAAKDELGQVLNAFARARARGAELEFTIAGPSPEEVLTLAGVRELPAGVQVLGRIPQKEVSALLDRSHFTVILREDKRSSHAGFSTKFVESFRAGVPVIGNITGDLGRYLVDGSTGIVVSLRPHSMEEALVRAASMSASDHAAMVRRVVERAHEFDYDRFVEPLDQLVRQVCMSGA